MVKKILSNCYLYLILLLLYLPILYLIIFSFTNSDLTGVWNGFSLELYADLFNNEEVMTAVWNTLIIAVTSSLLSTIVGTLGAIGLFYSHKNVRNTFETINQIPVVNAEIVIALSLTVTFVFVQTLMGNNIFSFWTLLVGHCCLAIPFVYLNVKPKLQQMDPALYEAAMDLGCHPFKALFKVIIPQILPGIFSGLLLAFTLSLDDFEITFFTRGSGLLSGQNNIETISTLVQAKIKKGTFPPELRALTTIIFLIVLVVVIINTIHNNLKAKKEMKMN